MTLGWRNGLGILLPIATHSTRQASVVDEPACADLALEADLFNAAETCGAPDHLRLWESKTVVVIMGRSGDINRDVHLDRCVRDGVPIARRISGGGAIVVGPGCLNYSLIVSLERRPELRSVRFSYEVILGQLATALDLPALTMEGDADLAWNGRKVSGNAQRRGLRALLHHGTLLCDFDVRLMDRYLKAPPRMPAYRRGRVHLDFVTNLSLPVQTVRARLHGLWPTLQIESHGEAQML